MAGVAGFSDDGLKRILKLTLVNRLPDSISSLQQIPGIPEKSMSFIIGIARTLCANLHYAVAVAAESRLMRAGTRSSPISESEAIQCFRCSGNYLARFCTERNEKSPAVCYRCEKACHIARKCGPNYVVKQPVVCFSCGKWSYGPDMRAISS